MAKNNRDHVQDTTPEQRLAWEANQLLGGETDNGWEVRALRIGGVVGGYQEVSFRLGHGDSFAPDRCFVRVAENATEEDRIDAIAEEATRQARKL